MGARIGDLLDDARPLHRLAVLEFVLERRVAFGRHRNLVHRSITSDPSCAWRPEPSGPHPDRRDRIQTAGTASRAFESTKPSAARTGNSSEPTAAKKVPIAGPEIGTATAHSKPCPCRPTGRLIKLSGRAEICLESAHLEVSPEIGLNALRRGDGSMKSGVVRNFMQEGGLP